MPNVFSRCSLAILRGLVLVVALILFFGFAGAAQANPGDLDPTFNPGGTGPNAPIPTSAVLTDGKIIIAGYFTRTNGVVTNHIARLNADGTLDTSFNSGLGPNYSGSYAPVYALVVQPDGKILIGGLFNQFNDVPRNYIARLNSDGSLDTSFDAGTTVSGTVFTIALQADGKIMVGGNNLYDSFAQKASLMRLNTDGSLDTGFNLPISFGLTVNSVIVLPDQKIVIGGSFFQFNNQNQGSVVKLNSDGSFNTNFAVGERASTYKLVRQNDGKIIVGGFTRAGNPITSSTFLTRFSETGVPDKTFTPASTTNSTYPGLTTVNTLALQADGKILVGGLFSNFGGSGNDTIVRLNNNGSVDSSFTSGNPTDSRSNTPVITSITTQPDGKILMGGQFTSYAGQPISYFARLKGTTDCLPRRVTAIEDDGTGNICGTFSHALQNAASPNVTVTFALTQGNTITLTGALIPDVPTGTIIDGGDGNGIIINGFGGDGLRLSGGNTLINLTVQRFVGREISTKAAGYNNKLRNVRVAS